jgi:hypothetical protein
MKLRKMGLVVIIVVLMSGVLSVEGCKEESGANVIDCNSFEVVVKYLADNLATSIRMEENVYWRVGAQRGATLSINGEEVELFEYRSHTDLVVNCREVDEETASCEVEYMMEPCLGVMNGSYLVLLMDHYEAEKIREAFQSFVCKGQNNSLVGP